jgi:hypothetical protein
MRLAQQVEHRDLADHRPHVLILGRGGAFGRELLGERPEPVAARPRKAVRHDGDRCCGFIGHGEVQPCRARFPGRVEGDVESVHAQRTSPGART